MVRLPTAAPAIVLVLFAILAWGQLDSSGQQFRRPVDVGNQACAACHKAIYDSYSSTAMARTSGPALANLIEGSFYHSPSDVSYGIERRGEVALLSYQRSGTRQLRGEQRLKYHVG